MTAPDAAYEAAEQAIKADSAWRHSGNDTKARAAVDAVWPIAYAAGHAAYMQQRRAEIAANLAEPGVADTEQALKARQDAILAEVRAQAHAAGVAEGRRQAAWDIRATADIRAAHHRGMGDTSWMYADDAARIAAGDKP